MKYFSYVMMRIFVFLFGLMPFWMVYGISNFVSFLLFRVVKYRRPIVESNIALAFPSKSSEERNTIARNSYRNLADIMVEGIKGVTMNEKQLRKRYKFINPEILDPLFERNKSAMLVTGHYNNWEWGALSTTYFFKHKIVGLYKKLSNPHVEKYFKTSRAQTGIILAELNETAKAYQDYAIAEKPSFFLMAADQSPSNFAKAHWVTFLGLPTACLHGVGKYAKEYNIPALYCDIQRTKRGHYELELSPLIEEDSKLSEGEIIARFMARLEKVIIAKPGNWLWSHKRWKRKYEGEDLVIAVSSRQ